MRAALHSLVLKISASIPDAEVFLRRIPNDDPYNFTDFVVSRIRTGEFKALDIIFNGEKVGVTVYNVEEFPGHRELISICTYTERAMPDFQKFWESEIEKLARKLGCKSVRMHTIRHGLIHLALSRGWNVAEVVLRKHL